ncbi:MAG: hypothetical protein AAFN77_02690 [Planctomycetota bacterium]
MTVALSGIGKRNKEGSSMKPITTFMLIALVILGAAGCSMCCGPYDYDYPTFGGKHQRVDPSHGRVGSIFSDPMAGYYGAGADSNLQAPPSIDSESTDDDRGDDSDLDLDLDDMDSTQPDSNGLPDADSLQDKNASRSRFFQRR